MDLYSVILKTGLFCLRSVLGRLGCCNGTEQMEHSRTQMPGLTQPFRADTTETPSEPTNLPGRADHYWFLKKGEQELTHHSRNPMDLWAQMSCSPGQPSWGHSPVGHREVDSWAPLWAGRLSVQGPLPSHQLGSQGSLGKLLPAPLPHGYPEPSPLTDIF